jgi:hypothetical protein
MHKWLTYQIPELVQNAHTEKWIVIQINLLPSNLLNLLISITIQIEEECLLLSNDKLRLQPIFKKGCLKLVFV